MGEYYVVLELGRVLAIVAVIEIEIGIRTSSP
jgi:hypothetical protein